MAPRTLFFSHRCLGLLVLAAHELLGAHSLPSWLEVPLLRLRGVSSVPASNSEQPSGPEALLLRQLAALDAKRDPAQARTLHAAVARILRADGKNGQALEHLEGAREAAGRSEDAHAILATRLELAEAYLEAGRARDADRELESEPRTNSLLSPSNFLEYSVKLDLASGRASFELGSTKMALETFQFAADVAADPEDVVRVACEMAKAHACLGHAERSLEPLRKALEVVEDARKAETLQAAMRKTLAMEVHSRFAEAFHALGDTVSAKAHYQSASRLQPMSTSLAFQGALAIKTGMRNLDAGVGPALRCPEGERTQRFQLPTQHDASGAFKAKISSLLEAREYKKAEYQLWHDLERQRRPYKSVEAATTLITLGNVYLIPERKSEYKAAHCFIQALQAALACCGPHSQQAEAAYKGLTFVQDVAPAKQRSQVAKAMREYAEASDKLGTLSNDLGKKFTASELGNAALPKQGDSPGVTPLIKNEASELEKLKAQLAERDAYIKQLEQKALQGAGTQRTALDAKVVAPRTLPFSDPHKSIEV